MERTEMQARQIARLKTIGKLELEKTELLSQMVFARAEEYNHLNIALNALGVATDHLEIVAEDAKEELNALKEKEYLAGRTDALLAEVDQDLTELENPMETKSDSIMAEMERIKQQSEKILRG